MLAERCLLFHLIAAAIWIVLLYPAELFKRRQHARPLAIPRNPAVTEESIYANAVRYANRMAPSGESLEPDRSGPEQRAAGRS